MKPIIEIEGVGKSYRIGANREKYLSLRDEMAKQAHGFYRRFLSRHRHVPRDQEFWALKDVSFSVNEGEAVGIIGRNGAGKSTLLKILSKITPPTTGKITLRGRMASLLEVGTGFHPELTGRENIYLNGAILGMTRAEIKRKFDEIVAFAEIEKFLDTPVKRYSSGMYVRLAFAVAAHLEPEILVVDEVLAVGDLEFQKKCLGKMGAVAKEGRTVLFVSHNMAAVQTICQKGILLADGKVIHVGPTNEIVSSYLRLGTVSMGSTARYAAKTDGITGVWFEDSDRRRLETLMVGTSVQLCIAYKVADGDARFRFAAVCRGQLGEPISCLDSLSAAGDVLPGPRQGVAVCRISRLPLLPGQYSLDVSIDCAGTQIEIIRQALFFSVEGGDYYGTGRIPPCGYGAMLADHKWSVVSATAQK